MAKLLVVIPIITVLVGLFLYNSLRLNTKKDENITTYPSSAESFLNSSEYVKNNYTSLESPPHPKSQEMLDNINKSAINPEGLNWVTLSDYFKNNGMNEDLAFDLTFPDDYFVTSVMPNKEGSCVLFRGKEEVMFEFCTLDDPLYIEKLAKEFEETPSQTQFKGKTALRRKRTNIGIFPKEELIIVNRSTSGEIDTAYHLKYPLSDLSSFTPQDAEVWAQYSEGYANVDIPVSAKMLDSLIFK